MIDSNDRSFTDPIVPITDDPNYHKLKEAQRQKIEEHANFVNQTLRVRRDNERMQFLNRMRQYVFFFKSLNPPSL
jgi:hypothetical protein